MQPVPPESQSASSPTVFDRVRLSVGRWNAITVPQAVADAIVLFVFFLALYRATRDNSYFFDSVLYAGTIEQSLKLLQWREIFEWNHPLWYPVTRAFYLLTRLAGSSERGYQSLQWFNALVGSLGIVLIFEIVRRASGRRLIAAGAAVATGLSAAYWSRATGGEPYLTGSVLSVGALSAVVLYRFKPRASVLLLSSILAGLAATFHIGNVVLWPIFLTAVAFASPSPRATRLVLACVPLAAIACGYAAIHGLFSADGVKRWWTWGSGLVNAVAPHTRTTGQFDLDLLNNLGLTVKTLATAFWHDSGLHGFFILAVTATAAAVKVARGRTVSGDARTDKTRFVSTLFGAGFVVYLVLYALWQPGNTIYWSTHVMLLVPAIGCGLSSIAFPKWSLPVSAAALLVLGGLNLVNHIWIRRMGQEAQPLIKVASALRYLTPRQSPILISGVENRLLKVYTPYFSRRNRIALQLLAVNTYGSNGNVIDFTKRVLDAHTSRGIPVFMTGDVLSNPDALLDWGVEPADFDRLWEAYEPVPFQSIGLPGIGDLYLLLPAQITPNERATFEKILSEANLKQHADVAIQMHIERTLSDLESGG